VFHTGELRVQHVVNAPIPKAPADLGDLQDIGAESYGCMIRRRRVANQP
jgi:hypothetical protein